MGPSFPDKTASLPDKAEILEAIDAVLRRCSISEMACPDVVVGLEIQGLQKVRAMVQRQWPLPDEVKAQINIGPVAAKNLADWNEDLAACLMTLQYVLTNDGDSLHKLSEGPPA